MTAGRHRHLNRQARPFQRLLCLLSILMCNTAVPAYAADDQAGIPCHIVVGPTSEAALNSANLEWANLLVVHLRKAMLDCRVEAFNAWPRAQQVFNSRDNATLYPEIEHEQIDGTVTGMPVISTGGFVIVTRAGTTRFHRIEDLAGLTVGTIRGRFYPKALAQTPGIEIDAAGSLEQNINKLLSGRIDATIEYLSDIDAWMAQPQFAAALQFGDEIDNTNLAFRFKNTASGQSLLTHFNNAITELINNGSYQKVYGKTRLKMLH